VSDIVNGIPAPEIGNMLNAFGHDFAILPSPEYAMPWDPSTGQTFFQWMAIVFSLMLGTAGLPHVIQRFYVVPRARDARWSVVWGLFFISILYWSAPVFSAFGKILSTNPEIGQLAKDAIVVYTAQLGDIHPLIVGFLAAGGVSAAFSTVSGLLVAGSSAFSHDLYFKVLNPDATPKKQMFMARMSTILMTIIVMGLAMLKLALIGQLVALAFSLAAVTIFPLFLLGIWWSGSNKKGAIAGLVVGLLVMSISLTYFIAGKYGVVLPAQEFVTFWLGAWYFAWIGAPLAILTNIVVSLMTEETPYEIRKFLVEKVHT
ncbi:MAG: cation acetate symporter, partial [Candidatus Delongbacteria bacterium]|nr:cation acetate symporter [Candidatus Delongbacteria bacterium]